MRGIRAPLIGFRRPLFRKRFTAPYSVTIGAGNFISGTELTASVNGLVGGETVTYQWTDDGSNITGATASTYTVTVGTDGVLDRSLIRVVVTIDGIPYTSNAREVFVSSGLITFDSDQNTFDVDDVTFDEAA